MFWNIFFLSLIPAVLWIAFFYYQDKYEKEPVPLIFWTFFLGCLSVIPADLIEVFFEQHIDYNIPFSPFRILITMLMVGVVEEFCKYLAVWQGSYKNQEFNEPMDGIVYGVAAAMGFAFIENIGYMLRSEQIAGAMGVYSIGFLRAIFSMFAHASFGVVLGSYLGRAKFNQKNESTLIIKGIFLAAMLHMVYNFSLFINKEWIGTILVLPSFLIMWRNMNRVLVDEAEFTSPFKPQEESYKPKKWKWQAANALSVMMLFIVIIISVLSFNKPASLDNEYMKYLVKYPAFWGKRANKSLSVVELYGPSYKGSAPVVRIEVLRPLEAYSIEAVVKEKINEITHRNGEVLTFETEAAVIGGRPGLITIVKWTDLASEEGKSPMMTYIAVTDKDGKIFCIRCDAREDQFQMFKNQFDGIIASFKFGMQDFKDDNT